MEGAPSEYYIAQYVFHEAMHNKLNLGFPMHDLKGVNIGAGTPGLGEPSDEDMRYMHLTLGERRPQWTEGFGLYRRSNRSY